MMDYEKKYNEALERAKQIRYGNPSSGTAIVVCEQIFPELAESEDEMIRRTLVEYFGPEAQLDFIRGVPIQKIRDWLEKQKEQKPCEDSGTDGDIMQYIEEGEKRGIKEVISFPEKYGLQKEQKPIWNEEDERIIKDAIYALEEVGGYPCIVKELKSLRPQPKPSWSEEEENKIESIKCLITTGRFADTSTIQTIWNILDDLRPSWKPSEEQMGALSWMLEHERAKFDFDPLKDLYEQLKKL